MAIKEEKRGGMRNSEGRSVRYWSVCSMARVSSSRDGSSGSSGERPSHPHAVVEVCEGRLRVIHGQHQAGAPHHQLVISVRQLPVQVVGGGGAGECRAAARVGT